MHPHDVSLAGRLDAFKAFRVRHPRLEEVDQQISRAIDGHRSYTLLALYGASGVGKPTVMKTVASRGRAGISRGYWSIGTPGLLPSGPHATARAYRSA